MPKKELHFKIEGANPHTLPMARLVEYLRELARLVGSEDQVHFLRVDEGSANCAMEIEEEHEGMITERVRLAKTGGGAKEAVKAFKAIRYYLDEDNYSASMKWAKGVAVIEFPTKPQSNEETFGPFTEEGSFDGFLVKIGGLDNTVPVHLVYQGTHYVCNTNRETARKLAPHIFGKPIRVYGKGKWYRNIEGVWELKQFDIHGFEELSDVSLLDVVDQLRAVPDNDLKESKDPIGDMLKLRHG